MICSGSAPLTAHPTSESPVSKMTLEPKIFKWVLFSGALANNLPKRTSSRPMIKPNWLHRG